MSLSGQRDIATQKLTVFKGAAGSPSEDDHFEGVYLEAKEPCRVAEPAAQQVPGYQSNPRIDEYRITPP